MEVVDKDLVKKAKRRIKRQMKTGKHQARVEKMLDGRWAYKAKHHARILIFKSDKLGRLKLQN